MRLAILDYADGKSKTQPAILLVAQLCRTWDCTPAQLRENDLGELLRAQEALAIYNAARKPMSKRTAAEQQTLVPVLELDMERQKRGN